MIFDEIWKDQWEKLDSKTKQKIMKIFSRLETDPYRVGNPLHYTRKKQDEILELQLKLHNLAKERGFESKLLREMV